MLVEPVICLNNNIFVINSKSYTVDGNQRCHKDHKDADRSILIYSMFISALVGAWYNNFMLILIL